jgi:hypothetical protein
MTMTGKLKTVNGGATQVTSTSEVNVVGILAQMGSRVITEVSSIMFEKFSQNFQALLQQSSDQPAVATAGTADATTPGRPAQPAAPIEGGSIAWLAFKRMFGNLLQGLKNLFSGRSA